MAPKEHTISYSCTQPKELIERLASSTNQFSGSMLIFQAVRTASYNCTHELRQAVVALAGCTTREGPFFSMDLVGTKTNNTASVDPIGKPRDGSNLQDLSDLFSWLDHHQSLANSKSRCVLYTPEVPKPIQTCKVEIWHHRSTRNSLSNT